MSTEKTKADVENVPAGQAKAPAPPAAATAADAELTDTDKKKISDALHLLEEVAASKRDGLKALMAEKYANLKSVAKETETTMAAKLQQAKAKATETAVHAKEVSTEKATEVAKSVDQSVHEKPWQFLGGVAVSALLLGWILGRRD